MAKIKITTLEENPQPLEGVRIYLLDENQNQILELVNCLVAPCPEIPVVVTTDENGEAEFAPEYEGAFIKTSYLGFKDTVSPYNNTGNIIFLESTSDNPQGISVVACKRYYQRNTAGTCKFSFKEWLNFNWYIALLILLLLGTIIYLYKKQ